MTLRVALACAVHADGLLRLALQHDGAITVAGSRGAVGGPVPDADVLVVDLETLGAAGLDIIRDVMRGQPVPVLALCPAGERTPTARQALDCGAVDAIARLAALELDGHLLRRRVQLVSGVSVVRRRPSHTPVARRTGAPTVVAMAASTGGPAALAAVLGRLAGLPAPVLLVQHLHADFMAGFVSWLGGLSALPVSAAVHGEPVRPGQVHVAPAGRHLRLGADRTLVLQEQPVTVHRPSADELFHSVAAVTGPAAIGVLLTGMGRDGAAGLLAMRRAGAYTLVQDEASCAVFGMPAAALALDAADVCAPLEAIAAGIMTSVRGPLR